MLPLVAALPIHYDICSGGAVYTDYCCGEARFPVWRRSIPNASRTITGNNFLSRNAKRLDGVVNPAGLMVRKMEFDCYYNWRRPRFDRSGRFEELDRFSDDGPFTMNCIAPWYAVIESIENHIDPFSDEEESSDSEEITTGYDDRGFCRRIPWRGDIPVDEQLAQLRRGTHTENEFLVEDRINAIELYIRHQRMMAEHEPRSIWSFLCWDYSS